MNELGLTRETVNQEIKIILQAEFAKFLRSKELEPMLLRLLLKDRGLRYEVVERAAQLLGDDLIERLRSWQNKETMVT